MYSALSTRELKQLLKERGIDYSKCFEKSELVALARENESKTPSLPVQETTVDAAQSAEEVLLPSYALPYEILAYVPNRNVDDMLGCFSAQRKELNEKYLGTLFYEILFRLGKKGDKAVTIDILADEEFFKEAFTAIREESNLQGHEIREILRLSAFGLTIIRNAKQGFENQKAALELYFDHLAGLFVSQNKKYRSAYCALCFKESCNIRQSHIVAKSILEIMLEGASINSLRLSNSPRKLLQSASAASWYMLCGDCELSFGDVENWFVREVFRPLYQDLEKAQRLPNKPDTGGKLYYFFLSLGFRALRWLTSSECNRNIAEHTAEVHFFMQALRGYLLNPMSEPPAHIRVLVLPTKLGDLHTVAYYANRYLTGCCGWSLLSSHRQPALFVHIGLIQLVISSSWGFSEMGERLGAINPFDSFGDEILPETGFIDVLGNHRRQPSALALEVVKDQIAGIGKMIRAFPDSVLKQIAERRKKGKPRTNRLRIAAIDGDSRMEEALAFLPPDFVADDMFALPLGHRVWCRTLCSTNEIGAKFIFHIGKGMDSCHYCILEMLDPDGYILRAHVLHFYEEQQQVDQFRFDLPGSSSELQDLEKAQELVLRAGINKLLQRIDSNSGEWPDMWAENFDEVEGLSQADWAF